jgi:hypothetical protein
VSSYDDDQPGGFDGEPDRLGDELGDEPDDRRWPLTWRGLYPRERRLWFEQLWSDACMLRDRYRLTIRSGWWEDQVQVEALAALAAWVARYDAGEWDDPPGKSAWRRCSGTATSRFIQSGIGGRSNGIWSSSAASRRVGDRPSPAGPVITRTRR